MYTLLLADFSKLGGKHKPTGNRNLAIVLCLLYAGNIL
jgi:hypothetical protein